MNTTPKTRSQTEFFNGISRVLTFDPGRPASDGDPKRNILASKVARIEGWLIAWWTFTAHSGCCLGGRVSAGRLSILTSRQDRKPMLRRASKGAPPVPKRFKETLDVSRKAAW
jgi:hypothetical protein